MVDCWWCHFLWFWLVVFLVGCLFEEEASINEEDDAAVDG
jgi:hypothetical protein